MVYIYTVDWYFSPEKKVYTNFKVYSGIHSELSFTFGRFLYIEANTDLPAI